MCIAVVTWAAAGGGGGRGRGASHDVDFTRQYISSSPPLLLPLKNLAYACILLSAVIAPATRPQRRIYVHRQRG